MGWRRFLRCDQRCTRHRLLVPVLAAAFLLAGCSTPSFDLDGSEQVANCLRSKPEPQVATGVFVQPDDGREPVLEELDAATCTIDVSIYLISDAEVMTALGEAVDRGVRVRVMLEEHPFGGGGNHNENAELLTASGADVRWSSTAIRFSHAKFAIVDQRVALIMNQNLTTSSFTGNREFGVVSSEPEIVDTIQMIFERDWDHEPPGNVSPPLIMSPDNSRSRYLALIQDARTSIDFYAEVIRDPEIMTALGEAERRGVAVRLILDETLDEDDQDIAARLNDHGVDIRLARHVYIHAKLMVIDGETAIVGSQNFTKTSLDDNRELAIELTDPYALARCRAVFERDWLQSAPGAPAHAGPQGASSPRRSKDPEKSRSGALDNHSGVRI